MFVLCIHALLGPNRVYAILLTVLCAASQTVTATHIHPFAMARLLTRRAAFTSEEELHMATWLFAGTNPIADERTAPSSPYRGPSSFTRKEIRLSERTSHPRAHGLNRPLSPTVNSTSDQNFHPCIGEAYVFQKRGWRDDEALEEGDVPPPKRNIGWQWRASESATRLARRRSIRSPTPGLAYPSDPWRRAPDARHVVRRRQ
ncbi:hypothetical protein DFP72DRAFT_1043906 [Ephemerocybe angulata]|uniref:Secreted protein n=1 Tax=Ephemerocybe angulata TaxID=980116 RepID=A0A8H6M6R0_9AGAR|nr:hypothetical protein DFP72DRAFT_1043906 [Tulosesus angulatus]